MSVLSVQNVSLRFGGLKAVNEVSFEVSKSQIFSVIGPNGAGKTSLFNTISGVYQASAGRVLIGESEACEQLSASKCLQFALIGVISGACFGAALHLEALWDAVIVQHYAYQQPFPWILALSAGVSYIAAQSWISLWLPAFFAALVGGFAAWSVWHSGRRAPEVCATSGLSRTFQNIRLFPELSAAENILIGMHRRLKGSLLASILRLPSCRREESKARQVALDLLRLVGLEASSDHPAGTLPYGSQRRLEIARALASGPDILLLDEPAAGMNPSESAALMELIQSIRSRGVTILLIEHDMKVVMGISDRIVVLDYGNKIAEGSSTEIKSNKKVIEAYLGGGVSK